MTTIIVGETTDVEARKKAEKLTEAIGEIRKNFNIAVDCIEYESLACAFAGAKLDELEVWLVQAFNFAQRIISQQTEQ